MKRLIIFVVVVIILAVAVAGYLLILKKQVSRPAPDRTTLNLQAVSPSDDVSVLDQELQATDLSSLDKELSDITRELSF